MTFTQQSGTLTESIGMSNAGSQPIKICHIIDATSQASDSRPSRQLSLLLQYLDRRQFENQVIVLGDLGHFEGELAKNEIAVQTLPKRWNFDPLAWMRLIQTLHPIEPDIVHSWCFASSAYGNWSARRTVRVASQFGPPRGPWIQNQLERLLIKQVDAIVGSNPIADFHAASGSQPESFCVIPRAVDVQSEQLPREDFFQRLNLPPRRWIIGVVGNLNHKSHLADLIYAAELVRAVLKDIWLVVVGDGPQRAYHQKLRDQYGSQDAVRFAGYRSDVSELISGMDLLWVGSDCQVHDTWAVEAMAAGVPIVAADCSGNRQLFRHGETGLLFDQGDVGGLSRYTCSLLSDDAQRARIGQLARQHVLENFSPVSMTAAYSQLYRRLVLKG